MRTSAAASDVHIGCAGCNFEESRPAAVKRIFQSNGAAGGGSFFFFFLFLWRDRLEVRQSPLRIELQIDHAREHGRRIAFGDDPRRQQIVAEIARHQSIGTLPVPVLQQGRPRGEHRIPVRRLIIFLHVVLEIAVIVEAERAVGGAARVPEARDNFAGLLGQHFRSLLQPHLLQSAVVDGR